MSDVTTTDEVSALADEIAETFGFGDGGDSDKSKKSESDETVEEEKETDQEAEEEEEDDSQSIDIEDEEEGEEAEEDDEEDKGEADPAEERMKKLEGYVEKLEERIRALTQTQTTEKQEQQPQEEEVGETIPEPPEFISEDDFQEVLSDPASLNKAIANAARWGFEEAYKQMQKGDEKTLEKARQAMRSELPKAIQQATAAEQQQAAVRQQFWSRNKDTLEGVNKKTQQKREAVVRDIATRIAASNPSMTFQQLSSAVEAEYRETLGFKPISGGNKKKGGKPKGPRKPRQASSQSRRPSGGAGKSKEVPPNSADDIAATFGY